MELKRLSEIARVLTANGSSGYVRVASGSPFTVGATVNLTSSGPNATGLQIADIKGFSGTTDVALYLIDPVNSQPFDASAYLTSQTATVTSPTQTLWYGVGADEEAPKNVFTDEQMQDIMLAILPGAATAAANVTVTNFPATQQVSFLTQPLPTGAATQTTLAAVLAALTTGPVPVSGTFWQATQPISAASLPLPTGAGTESTLLSILAKLNASVAVTGTVAVSNFPATQAISAVALPLPAGAATEATLAALSAKTPALGQAVMAASSPVVIASNQTAVPISAASLPLPTGAATAAAQTDGSQKVQVNQTNSFVDAGNSTTQVLGGGAAFTGAPLDCLGVVSLSLSASSNVVSAVDGIELQWSPDGVFWSTRGTTELPVSNVGETGATDRAFRVHDRFFRVKYTNGVTPQTWFKLQVLKLNYQVQPDGISVFRSPSTTADAIITKSIISGLNEEGRYQDASILNHDAHASFDSPGLAVRPILDQYYVTAFNEQRVSIPYTLADIVQKYGRDPRIISSAVNLGTITNALNMSGFTLAVPINSGAFARARTNEWYRYQTGRGQQILLSVINSDAGAVNQVRNWGYFDDSDGLLFRLAGTAVSVVRRTSTGEGGGTLVAPFEQVVPQTSWNVDKMDGTGHSGATLDVTKGNIYEVRFQWLGVGTVQWFINSHLVHQMVHAGTLPYPYMRTATLPLTWEVINTGASVAGGLTAICGHVTSQSGAFPPVNTFAAVSGPRSTFSAAELPLLSIRAAQTLNSVDNRVPILPQQMSLSETALNRAYIIVRLGATLTGAAWTSVDAQSSVEYDNTATALTGGIIIARYALDDGGNRDIDLDRWFHLNGKTIGRDAFTGVSDIITIAIQRVTATNPTVGATLMFHEIH